VRAGLDRRLALSGDVIAARLPHLGGLLGLRIDPSRYDEPLSPEQLSTASASPMDPRSGIVLGLAREGWSPRDILAHGAIDYHPTTVGPAAVHADHLQSWLEADAADGFWISPDIYEDGVDGFVDEVVPELRRRGVFPEDYVGATLRENLGVPHQYGLDPRVAQGA
jgi:alkanesulfonate monooxygenase SsuD/methylene tetrahydromethanopterin reductase-like flavin-dependent oxidoreductase (luciferase family)